MFKEQTSLEKKEKPPFLWHGTLSSNVTEFLPKRISTPGALKKELVPERVYASDLPAFSAAHSFPWATKEGFDLGVGVDGYVVFNVPVHLKDRLNQKVYIYKLPSDNFVLTPEETTGRTYGSLNPVTPIEVLEFNSVVEAVQNFGGEVNFIEK